MKRKTVNLDLNLHYKIKELSQFLDIPITHTIDLLYCQYLEQLKENTPILYEQFIKSNSWNKLVRIELDKRTKAEELEAEKRRLDDEEYREQN